MIPHIRRILGAFLFSGDDVFKPVSVLSGGEKSRLSLAKMLLKPTNFLIMDEPTNHIDIATKKILKNALLDYDGSLLIVSHDRNFLDGLVSKVYELRNGNIHVHLGSFGDFLEKKAANLHIETLESNMNNSSIKPEEAGLQKQQYLLKKEQNARKRKLTKELQNVEEKTSLLETQKKELDRTLLDTSLYSDKEKSIEINRQYKVVTQELNSLYNKWEIIHAELESVSDN
jgi:ATP-binding cassette subfamily F protein 3